MMRPILLAALGCLFGWQAQAATRIKDIISVQGVRANQLVGYGLVIGLNGTGDSLRNSPFTEQSLQSMLDRMGINVRNSKARTRNIAAVIVTGDLPAAVWNGLGHDELLRLPTEERYEAEVGCVARAKVDAVKRFDDLPFRFQHGIADCYVRSAWLIAYNFVKPCDLVFAVCD